MANQIVLLFKNTIAAHRAAIDLNHMGKHMYRVRKSGILIIMGLIFAALVMDGFFFVHTDKHIQSPEMLKVFWVNGSFQPTRVHEVSSKLSTTKVRRTSAQSPKTANSETLEIQRAIDKSALPNEFTIPYELLYLDDQPIAFDSEMDNDSIRNAEIEAEPVEEIDAIPTEAVTIPVELLELDNEPASPEQSANVNS